MAPPESSSKTQNDNDDHHVRRILKARNHYDVLELPQASIEPPSKETIRQRYKTLALLVHPDKNVAPKAGDAFKRLGAAHDALLAESELSSSSTSERQAESEEANEFGRCYTQWNFHNQQRRRNNGNRKNGKGKKKKRRRGGGGGGKQRRCNDDDDEGIPHVFFVYYNRAPPPAEAEAKPFALICMPFVLFFYLLMFMSPFLFLIGIAVCVSRCLDDALP